MREDCEARQRMRTSEHDSPLVVGLSGPFSMGGPPAGETGMRFSRFTHTAVLAALITGGLLVPAAQAAPGSLDPTFGIGGKVTTNFAGNTAGANAVAIQGDCKIVTAGLAFTGISE